MGLEVSLLKGWLPVALEVVAAVMLLLAIGWRDARWRTRRLPLVIVGSAVLGVLIAKVIAPGLGMTDPLPVHVWIWLTAAFGALVLLGVGWSSAGWGRRGAAVLAAVLAAVVGANGINQFVGYYPTVGDAVAGLQGQAPPGQVSLSQIKDHKDPAGARSGELVAVTIPDVPSGFVHRQELVYLPPVWFRGTHRPVLPVVEMIGAEHSKPENWVRIGDAVKTAQAYAAQHHGLGPILVFADATANFANDTECVNGPHGQAEDHLYRDIPAYISATFGASKNPKSWAVAGFSMGGTCAIGLSTEHSTTFGHFVDISGDQYPNTGNKAQTIANLFGGSAAAYAAHDPLTVIAKHGRYPALTGRYLDGTDEKLHAREANLLIAAGKKEGIVSKLTVLPGTHNWQFAESAFSYIYPWLCDQLGLGIHKSL